MKMTDILAPFDLTQSTMLSSPWSMEVLEYGTKNEQHLKNR